MCISYSVRISNELGSGNAKAAKFSIMVALGTSIIIGVIFWILCLVFSREISYLFTSSEEVAESVSSLHVLLAFSMLLNSVYPVLSGKFFILILILYANTMNVYRSLFCIALIPCILEYLFYAIIRSITYSDEIKSPLYIYI